VNANQNLNKKKVGLTLAPMNQVVDLGLEVAQVVAAMMKVEVAQITRITQKTLKRAKMRVKVKKVTILVIKKRKIKKEKEKKM